MFSLFLSTILFAAPIPKANNEGMIAILLEKKLVLLSPSGDAKESVELNDFEGRLDTVKLASNGEFAILKVRENHALTMGNSQYDYFSGYLVHIDSKSKPEALVKHRICLNWVLNRSATQIIATELDEDKMVKIKPRKLATKSWKYDIKTKEEESISLPPSYIPVDMTADGSKLLTYTYVNENSRVVFVPTSLWKPEFLSEETEMPYCMSSDGEKLLLMGQLTTNGVTIDQLHIRDLKAKKAHPIATPRGCWGTCAYSFSPDGNQIALVGYLREKADKGFTYRLYTCKIDGSGIKMIYESQPGDSISSIDWR